MENKFTAEQMMDFAWWFSTNSGQFSNDSDSMENYLEMWKKEQLKIKENES